MARIPTATGRETIARQPLAPRRGEGIFSTVATRATQQFAQTVADTAQQFEEALTLAEKTNADTEALRKLKELNLEAEAARTLEDISKFRSDYPNRITKIKQESDKLITLPQAKNEFGNTFDRDKILFDFNIRKTLQTNQNLVLESVLNENILEQRDSFINGDVVTGGIAENNRDTLLNDAINRGVLNVKEVRTQIENQKKEWRLARIDVAIERDAESALEQLQLGEKGIYFQVDASDRLAKEAKAETKLDRNKKVAEKITNEKHTKNEIDLSTKYFSNELFFDDIQSQFISGDISQKYAAVLDLVLTSPSAVDATDDEDIKEKLVDKYYSLDESNLDKLRDFRIEVLSQHGAGNLTRNTAEFLINKTVDPFTQPKADAKSWIATAIDSIKSWGETGVPPFGIANMVDRLLSRINEKSPEETISKTTQDIIKSQTKELNPNIALTDEKGTLMMDAFGNKALVFPDGTIKEID